MTKESIEIIRNLITEKEDRLSAIDRRLDTMHRLVMGATTKEELSVYAEEIRNLGEETKQEIESLNKFRKEVNEFYRPAA